jgi:3-deoxy-manno-octulosonate cytidylyltransferase (CMP-KDO synthetase)
MNELKSTVIIPARFDSSRFPGKPLAQISQKPMIQHVYERASKASLVSEVIVATDDTRIFDAVVAFGGEVQMTSPQHRSGTDRVAELAQRLDAEVVVNLQGDEPLIDPRCIDAVILPFLLSPELMVSTLKVPLASPEELGNPHVVKVVTDQAGYALYFSRAPIPYLRDHHGSAREAGYPVFKHVGLYGYRRTFLERLSSLKESGLEQAECLEQLRFLDNGIRIKVVTSDYQAVAVDTPEDLDRVKEIIKASYFHEEQSWQPNSSL